MGSPKLRLLINWAATRSTIGRELWRNAAGYQADKARQRARNGGRTSKVTLSLWDHVKFRLRQYWSPQQIAHELAGREGPSLSHEWIYQLIYADQADGGNLGKYLRHPRKHRKPQKPGGETRGRIPNRTSIDQRPEIVDKKERIGDWEIDLMEGAKGSGYLLTLASAEPPLPSLAGSNRRPLPA